MQVFIANLANPSVMLGYAHGSYGIGGIIGPIMATGLVTAGLQWSRFYAIALAFRALSFVSTGWSFWSYEKEGVAQFSNSLQQIASRQSAAEGGEASKLKLIGRALKTRTTLIGALFIFAYQGAEVSESGWVITYLIVSADGALTKVRLIRCAGISKRRSSACWLCDFWLLGRDHSRAVRSVSSRKGIFHYPACGELCLS